MLTTPLKCFPAATTPQVRRRSNSSMAGILANFSKALSDFSTIQPLSIGSNDAAPAFILDFCPTTKKKCAHRHFGRKNVKNILLFLGIAGIGLYIASHFEARSSKRRRFGEGKLLDLNEA